MYIFNVNDFKWTLVIINKLLYLQFEINFKF